jgi:hypothetical protein
MEQGQFVLVKIGEGNKVSYFLSPPAIIKQLVRLIPLKPIYNSDEHKTKYVVAKRSEMLISLEPMSELFEDEEHYKQYVAAQVAAKMREENLERIRQETLNMPDPRS